MKKREQLLEALGSIEKKFGKGSVMLLGETSKYNVKTLHTGSYLLNDILGGGYPEGRIVEIFGPESSGKTTLALHAIAEVQKAGGNAAFIDAEHALDPVYAQQLGVDINNLILAQPEYGEQALEIIEKLASTGEIKLIVVDSVSALTPKAEIEGTMEDQQMGLLARMMSKGLRKLTSVLSKSGTTVIFINQIRMNIGTMFGNPEDTTGGKALKFFASQRIDIRRKDKNGEDGYKAKVKVVKNKIAPPFRECLIDIKFGKGIDKDSEIVELSINNGIIEQKGGGNFVLFGENIRGKQKLIEYINKNEDIKNQLKELLRENKTQ